MKVEFKGPVSIDKHHYAKGKHELSDAYAEHWYLKALIKDKKAVVIKAAPKKPADEAPLAEVSNLEPHVENETAQPEEVLSEEVAPEADSAQESQPSMNDKYKSKSSRPATTTQKQKGK